MSDWTALGGDLIANIKRLKLTEVDRFAKAQMIETEIEAEEVRRRTPLGPEDSKVEGHPGALERSVHAIGPVRDGRSVTTAIVAGEDGSGAEDYVWTQHEDMTFFHPRKGEAKFLEGPLNESAPYMAIRIANRADTLRQK